MKNSLLIALMALIGMCATNKTYALCGDSAIVTTFESRCVSTGSVVIDSATGVGPFTYDMTAFPPEFTYVGASATNSFTGMPPGNYTVRVIDNGASNCFTEYNFTIAGTYTQPSLTNTPTAVSNCANGMNGELTAVMTDGRAPFTYEIVAGPMGVNTTNSTGVFTGLSAGTYSIRGFDSCGNIQTRQATIANFDWNVSNVEGSKITCGQYALDTLAWPSSMTGVTYGIIRGPGDTVYSTSLPINFATPDANIGNVVAFAKDACGNVKTAPFVITNNTDFSITTSAFQKMNCNASDSHELTSVTISGNPFSPVMYGVVRASGDTVWSSTLPVPFTPIDDNAIAVVKDACGVIKAAPARRVTLVLNSSEDYNGSCNTTDVTLTSTSSTFVGPLSYSISPNAGTLNGNVYEGLPDGTYTITATDSCGETETRTVEVGHDWIAGITSLNDCISIGGNRNQIRVPRRAILPVTVEEYDSVFTAVLRTQTNSTSSNLSNANASPTSYGWYPSFYDVNPGETYNYIITDSCGRKDTVTVVAVPKSTGSTLDGTVTPLCVNKGDITFDFNTDLPSWRDARLSLWDIQTPGTLILNDFDNGDHVGMYTVTDQPVGTYVLRYNPQGCNNDVLYDTVTIDPYIQPSVKRSIALNCASGDADVIAIADGGLAPYTYEILSTAPVDNPQPAQSSNIFTLAGPTSYDLVTIRAIDACGNSSLQNLAVREPAQPRLFIAQNLPSCNLSEIAMWVDSNISGRTYEWRGPDSSIISTNAGISLPVSTADTGVYSVRVVAVGTCYDRTAEYNLRARDFACLAEIGNYVWNDLDQDGIQDPNEVGVAGVTVTLFDASGNPVGTTVTDAYGFYSFEELDPGDYSVGFTLPPNYVFTTQNQGGNDSTDSDVDPTTGQTGTYTLLALDSNMTADAGIYFPTPTTASLGDYVWNDLNGDGIQDPGEPGFVGVTVTLYDSAGNVVATTITDASGNYQFDDLDPGTYSVGFTPPIGFEFSPQGQGSDSTMDSNVDPFSGNSGPIVLGPGENNPTIDAGLTQQAPGLASLGNYVWNDVNNDGIQDPGEAPVAGVTVYLYAADGVTKLDSTVTDALGQYIFNGLTPGDYVVGFDNLPAGFSFSPADAGSDDKADSDVNPSTGKTPIVTLVAGQNDMTLDAGIHNPTLPTGALGNQVWYDYNNDGIQDPGEPGVAGVSVTLYDDMGNPIATTVTDAHGNYIFNNLPAGNYQVGFENLPADYVFVTPGAGTDSTLDSDVSPGTGLTGIIPLGNGEVNLTVDAGITNQNTGSGTASLGDRVWNDANQDGIQDPNELGVPGVTVTLYAADGVTVIATTTTDALGNYSFTGLPAGDYVVGFSNIPSGYTFSVANQGTDDSKDADADASTGGKTPVISLSQGEENLTIDAGIYPAPGLASLGNYVWNDVNRDGVQDSTEIGVPGVMVVLYDANNQPVATTTTDANGAYQFTGLTPGDYYVQFMNLPNGFEFTGKDAGTDNTDSDADPNNGTTPIVSLSAGQNYPDLDAGIFTDQAGLGNYVWNDLNNDGIQDPNEPGIPGVTVTLYAADGVTPISTAITNASGHYSFVNLDPGTYVVGFSGIPTGSMFSGQDAGTNDSTDSDADIMTGKTAPITLGPGEYNPTIDAGVHTPLVAGLGNYVWMDANNDGIQDANEVGVPGVIVTLLDENDNVLQSAVTDQNGFYTFPNLPSGPYKTSFSNLPPQTGFTTQNVGNDSEDSDIDVIVNGPNGLPTSGTTIVYNIPGGTYNPTLDAGLIVQFSTPISSIVAEATLFGNESTVDWTTLEEADVSKFEIERSSNGQQFNKVATKLAVGNTNGETTYRITDDVTELMKQAVIYYRIKAIDNNGQFVYSNTVTVSPKLSDAEVAIYPVPFNDKVVVDYLSDGESSIDITLMSANGAVVYKKRELVQDGKNLFVVNDLAQLTPGVYVIKIYDTFSKKEFERKVTKN
jgi:protocatechuate 3,4-dioxygenase beta subunit